LLTERRRFQPYGLSGGSPGSPGENLIIKGKNVQALPGKGKTIFQRGDKLVIKTPGGGGYGKEP
jgi:N-methylhydantoinase B